jgi:hypothetical protein
MSLVRTETRAALGAPSFLAVKRQGKLTPKRQNF